MDYATLSLIIGAVLAVSELLSLIPAVQSNGVFQMIWNTFKILAGDKSKEV